MTDNHAIQILRKRLDGRLNILISNIELQGRFIRRIDFLSPDREELETRSLTVHDMPSLYDFYMNGLTNRSRQFYHPYPLFHTPPASAGELRSRFKEWGKETNWIVLSIFKANSILATSDLKRIGTEDVTSGIAVRDDFQGKGIGYLLGITVVEQARLLNIPRYHIKVVPENTASIKLHEKCGFKKTGEVQFTHIKDGKKITEPVIKMEIDLR